MGCHSVPVWPVLPHVPSSDSARNWLFVTLGCIGTFCLSLGYLLCLFYDRKNIDVETVILSSGIDVVGYLVIMFPPLWFLRVYLPIWTGLSFLMNLGLILALVTSKAYLVGVYSEIASDKVSLSFFIAYVSAAAFEEIIKLLVYIVPILVVKRHRTVFTVVSLAICSGCTFATIENLIVASSGVQTALVRFVWCTATHTSDCLVGALILAHIETRDLKPWKRLCGYPLIILVPIALHGTYDVVLFLARDLRASWMAPLSIVVGAVSLALALGLFLPFWKQARRIRGECVTSSDLIIV